MSSFFTKIIDSSGHFIKNFGFATSKIVCVGRNYSAHAKELNNPIPSSPLLFIKSSNSLVLLATNGDTSELLLPQNQGECQHELEIAVLIGEQLTSASVQQIQKSIFAIGLGLDLTLRDLQSELKAKSHPWERAKSFDGACPVTGFVGIGQFSELSNIHFSLIKNGKRVQQGCSESMLFDIVSLIKDISQCFTLYPGDIILTGTPEGVAALTSGDQIQLILNDQPIASVQII